MSHFNTNNPSHANADRGNGSSCFANTSSTNRFDLGRSSAVNAEYRKAHSGFHDPASCVNQGRSQFSESSHWEIWIAYVSQLPWGPGERDKSGYSAFLRAGSLRIDPDKAIEDVASRISTTGGTFNVAKLRHQQKRAYEHVGNEAEGQRAIVKPPQLVFDPKLLEKLTQHLGHVNAGWLKDHSPLPTASVGSRDFLEKLYLRGEKVVVFTVFESQGQCLYEVGNPWSAPLPQGSPDGVWFLVNPVDGNYHPNPRQENRESRRSQESVTSWRYSQNEKYPMQRIGIIMKATFGDKDEFVFERFRVRRTEEYAKNPGGNPVLTKYYEFGVVGSQTGRQAASPSDLTDGSFRQAE